MKKFLLTGLLLIAVQSLRAASLSDLGHDIYANSKITFLENAQVGVGYNLRHDNEAAPMAVLGIWQYRFLSANIGWSNAFASENQGIPAILGGVSVDKLTRLIAPNVSESVRSVVPTAIRPVYDKLVISYGPGYDLDRGEWTSFLSLSLEFGGGDLPQQ